MEFQKNIYSIKLSFIYKGAILFTPISVTFVERSVLLKPLKLAVIFLHKQLGTHTC
jgi:hypothetical protein